MGFPIVCKIFFVKIFFNFFDLVLFLYNPKNKKNSIYSANFVRKSYCGQNLTCGQNLQVFLKNFIIFLGA